MKRVWMAWTAVLAAQMGAAAREYVVYDLAKPETPAAAVEASAIRDAAYRTGSKMVFVRDEAAAEPVYMGVFEVSRAQAAALGWTAAPEADEAAEAYATSTKEAAYDFSASHTLAAFPLLTFPTAAQWRAYAGVPAKPCNVAGGRASLVLKGPFLLSTWSTAYASEAQPSAFGVFDAFGNVAEYTRDGGLFFGGYAAQACTFESLSAETGERGSVISAETETNSALLGARLVYTPPEEQRYAVTVTLNGAEVSRQEARKGEAVVVSAPDAPEGHRLFGPEISPAGIDGLSFTMPAEPVVFAYVSKPFLTLRVEGGVPARQEVFAGDALTLKADVPATSRFVRWELPDGSTAEANPLTLTVPEVWFETFGAGAELTARSVVRAYPRVLVYGGTATVRRGTGDALGEGYYTPGTELTLEAATVPGYTFRAWVQASGAEVAGSAWTVGEEDSVAVLQAAYDAADTPVVNPEETAIGEASGAEEPTAATVFGYEALSPVTFTVEGNTFVYYGTQEPAGDYACLDLLLTNVTYRVNEPDAAVGKISTIPLKRVRPAGEAAYYVGIYETTQAHYEWLRPLAEGETRSLNTASTFPEVTEITSRGKAQTFLGWLNAAFGLKASLPSKVQLEGITRSGLEAGEAFTGAGHLNAAETYGDPKITDSMVVCNRGGYANYTRVGSAEADPYGFYDLWGNVSEMLADGGNQLWGGNSGLQSPKLCNLQAPDGAYGVNIPGAFRPAITVPERLRITIDGLAEPFAVLPGQVIRLAPQTRSGRAFLGWEAAEGGETRALPCDAASGRTLYTATVDATLTPRFSDTPPTVTLAYTDCLGPEELHPGAATRLYSTRPGQSPAAVTVEPEGAAVFDPQTGVLTLSAAASGTVSVKAVYSVLPGAPGYLLRLE